MTTKETPATKEHKDFWSEDGQVFFHYGKGYGLTKELRTICLGSEEDIKRYLNAGDNGDKFTTAQLGVLEQIRIYREEEGYGESSGLGESGLERAADNGLARRKQDTVRQSKTKQRLPMRQARATVKGVSRQ